jgi:hypothetical protein
MASLPSKSSASSSQCAIQEGTAQRGRGRATRTRAFAMSSLIENANRCSGVRRDVHPERHLTSDEGKSFSFVALANRYQAMIDRMADGCDAAVIRDLRDLAAQCPADIGNRTA